MTDRLKRQGRIVTPKTKEELRDKTNHKCKKKSKAWLPPHKRHVNLTVYNMLSPEDRAKYSSVKDDNDNFDGGFVNREDSNNGSITSDYNANDDKNTSPVQEKTKRDLFALNNSTKNHLHW